ncbi:hypothetical protein HZA75_01455 [Candidatus Roizmanbacteria bacterium]|nr:hypothetical protein [Candidatus Roizmanbacteria bacterium]
MTDPEAQIVYRPEKPAPGHGVKDKFNKLITSTRETAQRIRERFDKTKETNPDLLHTEGEELAGLETKLAKLTDMATAELPGEDQTSESDTDDRGRLRKLLASIRRKPRQQKPQTRVYNPDPWAIDELEIDHVSKDIDHRQDEKSTQPVEISNGYDEFGDVGTNKTPLILKELQAQAAEKGFDSGFPTEGMLGDSDKIEGNQIDFVQQRDRIEVYFKPTPSFILHIRDKISSAEAVTEGVYAFQSIDGETIEMADCFILPIDKHTTIFVSKGIKTIDDGYSTQNFHSLSDAVRIEVHGLTDIQEITDKIKSVFELMDIPDALIPPDRDTETTYKYNQVGKQHKLRTIADFDDYGKPLEEEYGVDLIDHLQRKEVLPGYYPVIDEGASERYLKDGKVYLTHQLYTDVIRYIDPARVINTVIGGLYSSHERFKRGIFVQGISTEEDFKTGGADGIFLHAIPENAPVNERPFGAPTLLFDSRILDRLDWYAHNTDRYGEKDNSAPSPEKFFRDQRKNYSSRNEIVMNRGIPPEMITGLVYSDQSERDTMVSAFKSAGIEYIRGVPIEDFIKVYANFGELKNNQN